MSSVRRCLVASVLTLLAVSVGDTVDPRPAAAACDASSLTAAQLNAVFANPGVGGGAGYAGGDYQHVYQLPDGRKLWLFQDVFFSADNDLRDSMTMAAHNAGLVQNGTCWSIVGGPKMNNYIGKAQTTPLSHWFWPMDGEIGYDGKLWVFMAEMRNPNGNGATWGAAPVGTWVARIDPVSLAVVSFNPARDASTRLFGWSVTSDADYTYLYGHCYRQFTRQLNSAAQFDPACMPHTYLARVPKGRFDLLPQYLTGAGFTGNVAAAIPLITRGAANPMDVQKFGDMYVNVTKIDDWWGSTIFVDRASQPWGPWETAESINIVNERKCSQCGIYHAHLLPYLTPDGKMVLSWSNGGPFNLWQANAFLYRPSFRAVNLPTFRVDASLSGAGMQPRTPIRAVDTRNSIAVRAGRMVKVPLSGFVASNAVGVVANVTAVKPFANGYFTAWACGAKLPVASVLNFQAGRNTANAVHARLGPAKELCVMSSVDAHVLVDVTGSYVPTGGAGLHPLASTRIADTTIGQRVPANGTLTVPVAGIAGVPTTGVDAVTVTVTARNPVTAGFMTVWPCSAQLPTVSTTNFVAGENVTNTATMPLGSAGDLCVFSSAASDVTVDVNAWWGSNGLRATLHTPQRLFDSRFGTKPVAGSTTSIVLTTSLPPGTKAVIANIAAVKPAAAGRSTAWDCGTLPVGESLHYAIGENRAGLVATQLSGAGEICLRTEAGADELVDVTVSFQ